MAAARLLLPTCLALLLLVPVAAAGEEAPADPVEQALAAPQATGLLVTFVAQDSQAEHAGIVPGDVITSYAGTATPTIDALRQAVAGAAAASAVDVVIVRLDGSTKKLALEPGQIGVQLAPVEKGHGAPPLPPATKVAFDFSPLQGKRFDDWYDFTMEGKHVGFEHALAWIEDGRLHVRREVAFDGGEQWGVNHFDVTIVATAEPTPRLVSLRFELPIHGYVGEGTVRTGADGSRTLVYTRTAPDQEPETVETALPGDLPAVPDYLVETLACFMPREKGACVHFVPVTDSNGRIDRPRALVLAGEEEIQVAGETVKAMKAEVKALGGATRMTFWLAPDGHVVKGDYGGPMTVRATKEQALKDLHHGIRPRTAD